MVNNRFDVPPDCSVELSPLGYHFFTELFETFDKDQDGALNPSELDELFSTSPGNPWTTKYKFPDSTVADDSGAVTLQGWLAQWRYVPFLLRFPRPSVLLTLHLTFSHSASHILSPCISHSLTQHLLIMFTTDIIFFVGSYDADADDV